MAELNDTTPEEWRECPDYPEYSVSSKGRVRRDVARGGRAPGGLILKAQIHCYVRIRLTNDHGPRTRYVHRLVAFAFLGPQPEGKEQVNHINGIKTDNRVENLEWASPQDDADHRVRMGLIVRGPDHSARLRLRDMKGESNPTSKLTVNQVREIRRRYAAGETGRDLGRIFGIAQTGVSKMVNRLTWKHVE